MSEIKKLNAYEGVNNTVLGKDWYRLVSETCSDIYNTLAEHCGSLSTNAMIVIDNNMGNFNPSIFTKDGIDILNAVEYVSPIQSYIKGHIGYIGSRVDTAAHDGTTTAMLFAAKLLVDYFDELYTCSESDRVMQLQYVKMFMEQLKLVQSNLKCHVLTIDSIIDKYEGNRAKAQGYIAYIQSMITSKGNRELSECMRTIFEQTPSELYSYFSFIRESLETDTQYEVTYPNDSIRINVIPATNAHFNHALGTEYLQTNCDLIILTEDFIHGYAEVDKLIAHLTNTTTPTVVVFKKADSGLIQTMNICNPTTPIIALNYVNRVNIANTPIELNAINAITGVTPLHLAIDNEYIIHGVTCRIDRGTLIISNLYSEEEKRSVHVWYENPELNLPYTTLINELKTHIHKLENTHNGNVQNELMTYIKVLKDMIGGNTPVLKIGGKTLDNRASESVVKDVLGAITSSLEHGFIVDGNLSIYAASNDSPMIRKAILAVLSTIHNTDISTMEYLASMYCDIPAPDLTYLHTENISKYCPFSELFDDDNPVIQPIILYDELFDRLIEVLPKLMATSRVIVPGTANLQ